MSLHRELPCGHGVLQYCSREALQMNLAICLWLIYIYFLKFPILGMVSRSTLSLVSVLYIRSPPF